MSTNTKNSPEEQDAMDKHLPQIDKELVNYYSSLIIEMPGNEFHYKNDLMNAIMAFYFSNKTKFSCVPVVLKQHFTSATKSIITLTINEVNSQLFNFFCTANNRSKKQEAEYILTCFLLTLKNKNVDEIFFSDTEGLKFYKKGRVFNL